MPVTRPMAAGRVFALGEEIDMTRTSILLALSVCAASSAAAEEIRISFWVPPGHAAVRAFDDFVVWPEDED